MLFRSYTLVNTILKMAKKRALVDATLSAGRLSNIFTQDIEDMGLTEKEEPDKAPSPIKGEDFPKPEKVRNWTQVTNYAKHFFDLEETDCLKIAGKTDKTQVADAGEAWATIIRLKTQKSETQENTEGV